MDTFVPFTRELLTDETMVAPNKYNKEYSNFSYHIAGYTHIANYYGSDRKKVSIFAVELKKGESVERARSMQRNFVKRLMINGSCDAALVAFYTSGEPKWRLSFIRMDYEFAKGKISTLFTPAKRYSYIVGEGEPSYTAKSRLFPIFQEEGGRPSIGEIEEAFSVEKVTREFFEQYSEKYHQVREWLEASPDFMAEAEYHKFSSEQFAKKLMGQIAFLYFVQKKDWLGVNALPRILTFTIPNEFFLNISEKGFDTDGVLDIFARYNYTMNEEEPLEKEVAIGPEMFGRIFENLLNVNDRKSKGVFYTPREIVHYMCQESLANYLVNVTALPYDDIRDFISYGDFMKDEDTVGENPDGSSAMLIPAGIFDLKAGVDRLREIDDALSNIGVADPAVGSGVFLLGMLSEIIRARQNISAYMGILMAPRARRLMYAFDRHPYVLKKHAVKNCIFAADIEPDAVEITKLRLWLSLAIDEKTNPNAQYEPEEQSQPGTPSDLDCNIICGNSLVNEFNGLPCSLWELEFGRVFREKGGFDIVIGNPPYIDSENMVNNGMEELRNTIAANYSFTRGNWDIYIAFFEKSFRMLSKNGILSFITPDKWISKPFGDEMRKNLITNINTILAAGRSVFESVLVDSIITFIAKRESGEIKVLEMADRKSAIVMNKTVDKKILSSPFVLDIIFSDSIGLISRLESENAELAGRFTCENACATSDCYRLKDILYSLRSSDEFDPGTHMKVTNTGTIGRFVSRWGCQPMTYLKDKYLYPVVDKSGFLDMFTNTYGQKSLKKKIIIKGLTLLDCFIDFDGTVIPGKSTMLIPCEDDQDLKYLSAFINCSLMIFFIKQKYSSSSYNGGINFTKDMINHLPWREPSDDVKSAVTSLVDEIIAEKLEDSLADTCDIEERIDEYMYALYRLSPDEISTVRD